MAENKDRPPAEPLNVKAFLVELAVYAVFVTAYFLLVLHFLGGWLKDLFDHERRVYAVVAFALVFTQAAVLEAFTSRLLRFLRSRVK